MLKPDPDSDQHLVASIIDELKRGGPLNEPRRHRSADSPALLDHVRNEVQRSIDRGRERPKLTLPTFYYVETQHPNGEWVEDQFVELPKRTSAGYRTLGRLLRKMGFVAIAEQIGASDAVMQEPPPHPHADALKYYCAREMFNLLKWFSPTDPTGTANGPFRVGAARLYEAVTGVRDDDEDASMKRACDWVLKNSL